MNKTRRRRQKRSLQKMRLFQSQTKHIKPDYNDYKNIIYQSAHYWSNHNIYLDDLISEGNEAFVVAVKKFNNKKNTKFSSYLWSIVNNVMCEFSTKGRIFGEKFKKQPKYDYYADDSELSVNNNPEKYCILKDWISDLSEESQKIIACILETPDEIVQMTKETKRTNQNSMKTIRKYLKNEGWKTTLIESCFDEIRNKLKEL